MKALLAIDTAGMLGDDLFDQVSTREALDLRDRAFMVELVRGVAIRDVDQDADRDQRGFQPNRGRGSAC